MLDFFPAKPALIGLTALLLGACTLGPAYQRPEVMTPPVYREDAPWKQATPADALPKDAWWRLYGDPTLDDLQERARIANQDVRAALARLERARAAARISEADLLPRLDLDPSVQRGRTPEDLAPGRGAFTATALHVPFDLSYEIDLWGRVRRSVEAAGAEYQASAADLHNLLLIVHAEVARSYFGLRTLDAEIALLERTLELRAQNLRLVESLFKNGQVGRLDVARAETELASARSEEAGLRRLRAQFEHALAVLAGEPPAGLVLAAAPLDLEPPAIAPGLPSALLERRPDVAAAERRMAAANARIGVAQTAFFPAVRLTGSAGWGSSELSSLFSWDNRAWGLGPALSLPIFDAGRNRAGLEQAQALHEEAVALYRQSLLIAFREVEDALSDLRHLAEQYDAESTATRSAREAAELSGKRYRAGLVSYLEVVDAERTALASERAATRILGQRLQAGVSLIKALGGGWSDEALQRVAASGN
ncbi:efflux transporter outer membrane subunit [Geoalkalibacter sp.]|uniref:efflux transporter outer membrane subunit n=1 Tax=Geoalkalibacter sp. TaxID=3041440 RepID=UPI00272E2561|nr:efflux transporter outer membrane subunit [Geoalkalibacter sp.]